MIISLNSVIMMIAKNILRRLKSGTIIIVGENGDEVFRTYQFI